MEQRLKLPVEIEFLMKFGHPATIILIKQN